MNYLGQQLERPSFVIIVTVVALALSMPSLWIGLSADDHLHRLALTGQDPLGWGKNTASGMFEFLDGDAARTRRMIESGMLPWWTYLHVRGSFWRPLTILTHQLDYVLWPESPWLMHAHNLAWFCLLIVGVSILYRQLKLPGWVPGLAALLYALDDAHGWPVGWIANRNGLVATSFGVFAISAFIRARRDGCKRWQFISLTLLAAALLSAEAGLGTVAYLAAYTAFLDQRSWRRRVVALSPFILLTAVWWIIHHALGHGFSGSDLYIDPTYSPVLFLKALVIRAPILLLAQFAGPPAFIAVLLPVSDQIKWALAALPVLALLAYAARRQLNDNPTSRFLAVGMLLSLLPISATFPHDRLLLFTGIGAMGLIAQVVYSVLSVKNLLRNQILAFCFAMFHLISGACLLPIAVASPYFIGQLAEREAAAIRTIAWTPRSTVILINPPVPFFAGHGLILLASENAPLPTRTLMMATGSDDILLQRVGDQSLLVRSANGFISGPMDSLFRSTASPFEVGEHITLSGVTIIVTALMSDGRPSEVIFQFDRSLEDPELLWRAYIDLTMVPFQPPPLGKSIMLAGQSIMSLEFLRDLLRD